MDWRKTRIVHAGSPLYVKPPPVQQVGGNHYQTMLVQPHEFIYINQLDFFQGSVIKYVSRWDRKNGIEDLKKARGTLEQYVRFLTNVRESDNVRKNQMEMHFPGFSVYVSVCQDCLSMTAKEYCEKNNLGSHRENIIDCIIRKDNKSALQHIDSYISSIELV